VSDPATNGADDLGFLDRARLRRRLRHLEQVKELGLRDVGGLQLELHRAGTSNKKLVDAKLKELRATDDELRALRTALEADDDVIELRETGIAACENCGALVGSDAKFCSACGTQTANK
jgi:hypothetical protein